MLALVIGGAASGKSAYAESLAGRLGNQKIYIATMEPFGEEAEIRIAKHRNMRAEKGFWSVDCYRDLASLTLPEQDVVLLECLTNLLANECYGGDPERISQGIDLLRKQTKHLVIVSGDVFCDGDRYSAETLDYIRLLGELNRALAAKADVVVETVAGIALVQKGSERLERLT